MGQWVFGCREEEGHPSGLGTTADTMAVRVERREKWKLQSEAA